MKLYGKNPVIERIKTNPASIRKIYLQKKTDLSEIVREAKRQGLDFESVEKNKILSMAKNAHTQGVVAEVSEFKYAPFSELLENCTGEKTSLVFLDGITDPQNLGSIIRNLACMGGFSIVLPEHNSAQVNETVLRVACGGENYIKIGQVTNNARAIEKAKARGVWIIGAVAGSGKDIQQVKVKFPLGAVIGSEGKGIRPGLVKHIDAELSLPMKGAALSYNASVAAVLVCYEINRQERLKK